MTAADSERVHGNACSSTVSARWPQAESAKETPICRHGDICTQKSSEEVRDGSQGRYGPGREEKGSWGKRRRRSFTGGRIDYY